MFLKQVQQSINQSKTALRNVCCYALLLLTASSSASAQCIAELVAADGAENDRFGNSVAVSGNVAVIGAVFDDDGGPGSGTAFIFEFDGTNWNQMAKITPSDHAPSDQFGSSVAIDGDVVVVGAQASSQFSKGAAYIFIKPQSGWTTMTETAKLTADGGADFAYFGWSAAISGDTIVIGAAQAFSNSGAAYVFEKPGSGWETMLSTARLTVSDPNNGDHFAQSVAIHGDTIAVGANDVDINGITSTGAAYVFVKPNEGWIDASETATLTASDGEFGDVLGTSITISEDVIIVGAPINSFGAGPGLAYIYHMPKGGWISMTETLQFMSQTPIEDDHYGHSVSISGDLLVVAAHFFTPAGSDTPGTTYVYTRHLGGTDNWGLLAELSAIVPTAGDEFGQSVSIDGEMVLVGADFGSNGANGSVYAFNGVTDCNDNGIADLCELDPLVSEDSGQLSPIGGASPQSFTIFDAPDSTENVVLRFFAQADLGSPPETISVDINGEPLGTIFDGNGSDCPAQADQATLVVPMTMFNDSLLDDGNVTITMAPTGQVDPTQCGGTSYISINVSYIGTVANDTNGNGIPDDCEAEPCPWDSDLDGTVGTSDLLQLFAAWGPNPGSPLDFDEDGTVGTSDLLILFANWGPCP